MKKKQFFETVNPGEELNYLYEYKSFLLSVQQIRCQLQTKLSSVNYNNLQIDTFFSPFEIIILKNQINGSIEELEEMILKESISAEDFHIKTEHLNKRIELLSLPLDAIKYKLGYDYNETRIVA